MNPGASAGRIPANVSLAERARVTAGLANDVDAVNQYAAVMYPATAKGTIIGEGPRAQPQMTASNPNVATNSLNIWAGPERTCCDAKNNGSSNITWAAATPAKAPTTCPTRYGGTSDHARPPWTASASVTAGLKWAPEIGPKVRINATRAAPVASVFASSATATLPPARRSPMMPEPTTAASSIAVPTASATRRRSRPGRLTALTPSARRAAPPAAPATPRSAP